LVVNMCGEAFPVSAFALSVVDNAADG